MLNLQHVRQGLEHLSLALSSSATVLISPNSGQWQLNGAWGFMEESVWHFLSYTAVNYHLPAFTEGSMLGSQPHFNQPSHTSACNIFVKTGWGRSDLTKFISVSGPASLPPSLQSHLCSVSIPSSCSPPSCSSSLPSSRELCWNFLFQDRIFPDLLILGVDFSFTMSLYQISSMPQLLKRSHTLSNPRAVGTPKMHNRKMTNCVFLI